MSQEPATVEPLLGPEDPEPYARFDRESSRPVIVVCDHGSNCIPRRLGTLGVAEPRLADHIAVDIGAAGVARGLAERLGASEVIAGFSRLVVDLNRSLADPSAFPAISDGVLVPANVGLAEAAKAARVAAIYAPYHAEIDALIGELSRGRLAPVLVAVHSFTPQISGVRRPWHAGVLWDKDPRLAFALMRGLRADRELIVGDNEPYSGRHIADYTIDYHAELSGIAHAAIEIRQDLIQTEPGQAQWAERLASILAPILEDESLYARRNDPQRSSVRC